MSNPRHLVVTTVNGESVFVSQVMSCDLAMPIAAQESEDLADYCHSLGWYYDDEYEIWQSPDDCESAMVRIVNLNFE